MLGAKYLVSESLGLFTGVDLAAGVDATNGRKVALERLPRAAASADATTRFRERVRAFTAARHASLLELQDSFEHGGAFFVATEPVPPDSLAARLARQPAGVGQLLGWLLEAMQGVAALHRRGLVHGALCPALIFFEPSAAESERVRVAPLVLAGLSASATADEVRLRYGSMETLAGATELDARADIYAFGAIAYHALAGRSPYETGDVPGSLLRIMTEAPAPLRSACTDLPDELCALIDLTLSKRREQRLSSLDALIALLEPWARQLGQRADPPRTRPLSAAANVTQAAPSLSTAAGVAQPAPRLSASASGAQAARSLTPQPMAAVIPLDAARAARSLPAGSSAGAGTDSATEASAAPSAHATRAGGAPGVDAGLAHGAVPSAASGGGSSPGAERLSDLSARASTSFPASAQSLQPVVKPATRTRPPLWAATWPPDPGERRRRTSVAVTLGALAIIAIAGAARSRNEAEASAPRTAAAAQPPAVVPSPHDPPLAAPAAEPIAPAEQSAPIAAPLAERADAAQADPAPPPKAIPARKAARARRSRRAPERAAEGAPNPACTPNYVFDAQGEKHWKPECF